MAAGSGFKTFNTGDVLSAADTNNYLMQGVWVFADAAARTAAVTSPQEGNMSFLKDTNSTEYYSGSAWVAVAGGGGGGGKVLQVVQGSYSTQTAVASTSLTDTGLSLAITPTLNTSKVLVLVTQSYNVEVASNINISFEFDIKRGSTSVFNQPINGGNYWNWDVAGLTWQHREIFTAQYLDSPATTSSTTYKTQGRLNNTTNRILRFQGDGGVSTITLLEIGA